MENRTAFRDLTTTRSPDARATTLRVEVRNWPITPQPNSAIVASVAVDSKGDIYMMSSYDHRRSNDASEDGAFAVYKYSPGGRKIWKFLSSYVLHSSPVIDEARGVMYFGGNDKRLLTLSIKTGKPVSCFTAGDAISASPALLPDGSIVFAAEDGYLYACSPGCKKQLWKVSLRSPSAPAPTPAPQLGGGPAQGDAYAYFMSSPVVLGGGELILAVNYGGVIIAVSPRDGSTQWRASLSSAVTGGLVKGVAASPAIGRDGSIYIPDYEGNMHTFAGNGGCPAGYRYTVEDNSTAVDTFNSPPPPTSVPPRSPSPPPSPPPPPSPSPPPDNTTIPSPPPFPPPPPLPPFPPPPPLAPVADVAEGCEPCPVGTVAPSPSLATTCKFCGAGLQAVKKDEDCKPCPSGTFRTNDPVPYECQLCPAGEWQDLVGASYCLTCNNAEWCKGGNECKSGHTGLACSECEKGWFFFQGTCFECQANAQYYSLIFIGVCLCAFAIFVVVFADKLDKFQRLANSTKKAMKKKLGADEKKRMAKLGTIVFLVSFISYMQIQSMMVSVRIKWPSAITDLFIALGAMINFDVFGMISPQCSVDLSFEQTWMIRLVSPICILVPVAGGIYYMSLGEGGVSRGDARFVRARQTNSDTPCSLDVVLFKVGARSLLLHLTCLRSPCLS